MWNNKLTLVLLLIVLISGNSFATRLSNIFVIGKVSWWRWPRTSISFCHVWSNDDFVLLTAMKKIPESSKKF